MGMCRLHHNIHKLHLTSVYLQQRRAQQLFTRKTKTATTVTLALILESAILIVLLHAGAGHTVNDGIPPRIHIPDDYRNREQREHHRHSEP